MNAGVDIETGAPKDLTSDGIMDLYATKWWAIKLATDAVITVLKVDQIIMAKQVGRAGSCWGLLRVDAARELFTDSLGTWRSLTSSIVVAWSSSDQGDVTMTGCCQQLLSWHLLPL